MKEGEYVDNGQNLIRTEPTDCPPDAPGIAACPGFAETGPGGYTYQDFGLIASAPAPPPEPHADGEIWGQTLWQLRQRSWPATGRSAGRPGRGYITGGMRLGPPQPSYLDQRNAILQASTLAGGADTSLIWEVFASRGMGYFASTKGDFDYEPDADFSVPPTGSPTGIVRGVVRGDNGGRSRARSSASAATTARRTPARRCSRSPRPTAATRSPDPAGRVPAAHRRGAGRLRRRVRRAVAVGSSVVTRDLAVRRNYADDRAGGSITSDARNDAPWGCGGTRRSTAARRRRWRPRRRTSTVTARTS